MFPAGIRRGGKTLLVVPLSLLLVFDAGLPSAAFAFPSGVQQQQGRGSPQAPIEKVGLPWTGSMGVRESVAQIKERQALAPPVEEVCAFACRRPGSTLLLDTWDKKSPPRRTLLDWLPVDEVARLCRRCREAKVRVALAGSLGPAEIESLRGAAPTWFAVRGAACAGGQREESVQTENVRALVGLLTGEPGT